MKKLVAILAAVALPSSAAAAGPMLLDGPDVRPAILGSRGPAGWDWELLCPLSAKRPDGSLLCSDGRPITTARAGPAWERTAEGTAVQVPANVAAVEPVTPGPLAARNEWTNSANFAAKTTQGTPTLALQADGSWLVEDTSNSSFQGVNQAGWAGAAGETWTLACEAKAGTSTNVLLGLTGSDYCAGGVPLPTDRFGVVSCTKTLTTATTIAFVYPAGPAGTNTGGAYFKACWLTKTPVAVERLDCGSTPCTRGTPGEGDVQARALNGNSHKPWLWALVDTPIVTQTSDGANVTDDSTTATEGIASSSLLPPTPNTSYTWTCEVAPDTSRSMQMFLNFGGGWSKNVTTDVLPAGAFSTVSVTHTSGASPSYIVGAVYLGGPGSSTGTYRVRRCQLEPGDVFSGVWIPTAGAPAERRSGGGLEAFGSATQYVPNSAATINMEATNGTVTQMDGFVRWTGASGNAMRDADWSHGGVAGETWIATCEVRSASGSGTVRIEPKAQTVSSQVPVGASWVRVSSSPYTLPAGDSVRPYIYAYGTDLDVRQCQLEKASTPGRRCDCGATAPCTCLGDVHTVASAGWPVSKGEVSFYFTPTPATVPTSGFAYLMDTRGSLGSEGAVVVISTTGAVLAGKGGGSLATSQPLAWVSGVPYRLRVAWDATTWQVWRRVPAGVAELIATGSSQPLIGHGDAVLIGAAKTLNSWANGSFYGIEVTR